MSRPKLWVELCAGSAAVAIRLVGGPNANPPIGFMGGKRGYSRAILGVLGLRQGLGAHQVVLNDPGPWGPVWRVLTTPGKAEEVAEVIRGWKDEEPRALWDRLKAEGWGELTEAGDVANWAVVGTVEGPSGIANVDNYGHDPRTGERFPWKGQAALASRVEAVARWLVCGRLSYKSGEADSGYAASGGGTWPDKPRSIMPVADRCKAWPVPCHVFTGSALDVPIPDDCEGVHCYIDPPYVGCTGYAADLPREDVIRVAQAWSDAGAVVCISEAEPLDLAGWHHVEITSERKGQKRTFSKQQREWLTMNREPACRPSV